MTFRPGISQKGLGRFSGINTYVTLWCFLCVIRALLNSLFSICAAPFVTQREQQGWFIDGSTV